ncbi:MAG: type III-B CRISPR module RAMP protein Cmr4 [Nitrospiraceae bacterium]|nr:type III-B CRISPR module RAMP protein Cmr4 [Nitrospiraceae bacterium]
MNMLSNYILSGIYNITPLHCGTGQTTGAVDLPIARDSSTGFPVLPATTLKGVARFYCSREWDGKGIEKALVDKLFGPTVEDVDGDEQAGEKRPVSLEAGALIFSEGRLLAYPVRSLNRPFFHITCPLILDRLERDLEALKVDGGNNSLPETWRQEQEGIKRDKAYVAQKDYAQKALVLEDLVYGPEEVIEFSPLNELAKWLCRLLPEKDKKTRKYLETGLVLIPDEDFADLMQRVIPVQPHIKLVENKTSDNLWYAEALPSDCLFFAIITQRPGHKNHNNNPVEKMRNGFGYLEYVQIGGNETVGNGLCYWTLLNKTQGS